MPERSIVCAGCGARYRLPETFSASQVRCKKCGATIDVASPAPARPAAAPPSRVSSARPGSTARASTRASSRLPAGRGAHARPGARAGSYADQMGKKQPGKVAPIYVVSGVGLLVVIGVAVIVVLNMGKHEPPAEPAVVAKVETPAPPAAVAPPAPVKEPEKAQPEKKAEETKPAETPKPQPKKRAKVQALGYLPGTSEEQQSEIKDLITTLTNLDLTRESDRARDRLIEIGPPAVPRLLTRMQELKLDDDQEIIVGSLINKTLSRIAPSDVSEAIAYPVQGTDKATVKQREAAIQRWYNWWMPIDEEKRAAAKPTGDGDSPK
jgi:hypothetical protein